MIDTRPSTVVPTTPAPLAASVIDLSVVAANLALVRSMARTPVMAVVKADAFGLGATEVARTVIDVGAEWLGVATIDEALALRRDRITAPILAWLVDARSAIDDAVREEVTVSCSDISTLEAVADAAWRTGRRAVVHIELDTGMCRGGAGRDRWRELFRAAASPAVQRFVDVDGIWSHLASASNPEPVGIEGQHAAFLDGVAIARSTGLNTRILHLANSAAAIAHPACRFSMVRVGAALYGIETVDGVVVGLRSPVRVTSRVVHVRRVTAGSEVGYGGSHRISRSATLALVPVGYADGVPRSLSGAGSVSIGGRRHPIVGSISMDQLVVDVGDHDVRGGEEVVLLGSADAGEPEPREWAELTGTVVHEILTGLGHRIARTHVSS